ncbi:MAG: endolytic transglycosylase MltG [candidate division WOR-3 bacterium]
MLLFFCCDERPALDPKAPKVTVEIEPGMSVRQIAQTLADRSVIDNPLEFRYRLWRSQRLAIHPGRYRFPRNSPEKAVLAALTRTGPAYLMVTIPEGLTIQQTASILSAHGICDSTEFLAACSDTALLQGLGVPFSSAEGFLFPETYEFRTGTQPAEVVTRLVSQFWRVFGELDARGAVLEPGEAVILASIVEKEAQVAAERPIIAGVFMNRLRRHLPLQSCATVEFLLPEHKERLSYQDLKTPSPYNTYLHPGLPPGPICSPGRASLEAALQPARHNYLFFVSRGDGSHIFSATPDEHEAALRKLWSRASERF